MRTATYLTGGPPQQSWWHPHGLLVSLSADLPQGMPHLLFQSLPHWVAHLLIAQQSMADPATEGCERTPFERVAKSNRDIASAELMAFPRSVCFVSKGLATGACLGMPPRSLPIELPTAHGAMKLGRPRCLT